jgi:probable rRNA maturation factor
VIPINVSNRQRSLKVNRQWLKSLASLAMVECLHRPAKPGAVLLGLENVDAVIVSDKAIATIHKQFLNEAEPTDVITFEHGEIIISAQTAQANARRYGSTLDQEIGLYIIHGLLHLNGYKDLKSAEAREMENLQKSVLKICQRRIGERKLNNK